MKRIISLLLVLALLTGNLAPAVAVEMQETTAPTEETAVETTEVTVPTEEETEPTETTMATEPETVETTVPTEPEQVELEETAEAKNAASGTCGENLTWTLDDAGTLTVSGTGAMDGYAYNDIPWYSCKDSIVTVVIENGVTRIDTYAFYKCSNLSDVSIPASVTEIGGFAFGNCTSLKSITIPSSVTSIGAYAFENCTNLISVTIPSGVTMIDECTFYDCSSLTSVTIPTSVTLIGESAFYGCSSLKKITIPDSVTTIEYFAFQNCSALTSVTIPNSVTSMKGHVFGSCTSLESITISTGLTTIPGSTFSFCSSLKTITIPDNITSIGGSAFAHCTSLTRVTIPDSVTSLGNSAFAHCTSLKTLEIPSSVTSIAARAFDGCSSLTSITIPSGVTELMGYLFFSCSNLTSVTIPKSIASIGQAVFQGCSSLKSVVIPEGVTRIEDYTFDGCNSLSSVTIPTSVTYIGEAAFSDCSLLTQITLPNKITDIPRYAFSDCSSLTSITIPTSVTSIGLAAFQNCSSLKSVTMPLTVTSIDSYAFSSCDSLKAVYYEGQESDWSAISIADGNYGLQSAKIYYNSIDPVNKPLSITDGTFTYWSTFADAQASYTFDYEDSWFLDDTVGYNHDLCKMSMRMALAAGRRGSSSIEDLFKKLELEDPVIHYPAPTEDTIGFAIASKEIPNGDDDPVILIAVAVRGKGYGDEWGNNFDIGSGVQHRGFSNAADTVLAEVRDYISEHGFNKNLKLWFTGYSRAGAVCNLASQELAMDAYNGKITGLNHTDVIAYCLECPQGVYSDESEYLTKYGQIYNIINFFDPVPMLAPDAWDYTRYGTSYYLPSNVMNYKNFATGYANMKKEYAKILKAAGSDEDVEDCTKYTKAQTAELEETFDAFASFFTDPLTYSVGHADTMARIAMSTMGDTFDFTAFLEALVIEIPGFLVFHPVVTTRLIANGGKYFDAHEMELCLAWLDSLDGYEWTKNAWTRYLTFNCPVDVSVYDSAGILVAQIVNDEVQEIEGSTIGATIDENGQKIVCLPLDETFDIQIHATGDGTMSYQIKEFDLDSGDSSRLINYYDIPIEEGDILTGTAASSDSSAAEYTLLDPDDQEIAPSNALTASEIGNYTVTISAVGNGTAAGGGLYVTGEFAKLVAEAKEGENFLGWYEGDTLLSADAEYRFRVEADRQIVGKFTKNTNGDLNGDSLTDAQDVTHLVWHLLFAEAFPLTNDADFDCDGDVDLNDAADLLWQVLFPVTQ